MSGDGTTVEIYETICQAEVGHKTMPDLLRLPKAFLHELNLGMAHPPFDVHAVRRDFPTLNERAKRLSVSLVFR